jgi:hypothetical protein
MFLLRESQKRENGNSFIVNNSATFDCNTMKKMSCRPRLNLDRVVQEKVVYFLFYSHSSTMLREARHSLSNLSATKAIARNKPKSAINQMA